MMATRRSIAFATLLFLAAVLTVDAAVSEPPNPLYTAAGRRLRQRAGRLRCHVCRRA